jgi:hypothetical protein
MSAVADLENAIIARLAAALTLPLQTYPKVEVRAWPDKPASYRMTHPNGATLIIYRGSNYTHSSTAGQFVRYDDIFELGLISRNLREANTPDSGNATQGVGIYELLQTCRDALLGGTPNGASGAVRMIAIDFESYSESLWSYSLRFSIPQAIVANRSGPIGPWVNENNATSMVSAFFNPANELTEN